MFACRGEGTAFGPEGPCHEEGAGLSRHLHLDWSQYSVSFKRGGQATGGGGALQAFSGNLVLPTKEQATCLSEDKLLTR